MKKKRIRSVFDYSSMKDRFNNIDKDFKYLKVEFHYKPGESFSLVDFPSIGVFKPAIIPLNRLRKIFALELKRNRSWRTKKNDKRHKPQN